MTAVAPAPVSSSAALHLRMLWPHARPIHQYPFDQPSIAYYYLARNGIHALATAWNLGGAEMLVPAYCHGVEMQALLHAGVSLRYYPVHAGMEVRAEDVRARLTPRTRAVYLIHYAGFPGPVEELAEFCRRRGLLLIEDCALSLLSKHGDRNLGSFGDAAVFCLYKTLPLPHGGAVVVRDGLEAPRGGSTPPSIASTLSYTLSAALHPRPTPARAAAANGRGMWPTRDTVKPLMRTLGMVSVATETFDAAHVDLGMSALCTAVIAAQDYPAIVERRRRNYERLYARLSGRTTLVLPALPVGVCPLFFPIATDHKLDMQERLAAQGIHTVNFWSADAPGVARGEFPEVDELRRTVLELPCHQDMTLEAVDRVADEVIRSVNRT